MIEAPSPSTIEIPAPDAFQQRVIDAPERSIRVVAPAGSGKTETLARRVEKRIRDGVSPRRILVLTFDRNAAESFRAKLRRGGAANGVRVETLNAYGYALLRRNFPDERTRMITEPFWPSAKFLSELVNEYGRRTFDEMLSKLKNQSFDPRTMDRQALIRWIADNKVHLLRDLENELIDKKITPRQFGHDLASEFFAYEKFLADRGGIDFDDQKLRPLILLRQTPHRALLERIQGELDEVIVDEFQDINKLDCELIDLISPKATMVVTGDDDQAIYGFRGASAEYLIQPKDWFSREFTHYELSMNYRCPRSVLGAAGQLIERNATRIPKHPEAAKPVTGQIETITAPDAASEAIRIARRAGQMLRDPQSGDTRTVAVLARTNHQFLEIQSAFVSEEVPYAIAPENDIRITWEQARRMLLLAPSLRDGEGPSAEQRAEIVGIFGAAWRFGDRRINDLRRMARADERAFPSPLLIQAAAQRHRTAASFLSAGIAQLTRATSLKKELEALEGFLNAQGSRHADTDGASRRDNGPSRLTRLQDVAALYVGRREAFLERLDEVICLQREALRYPARPKVTLSTCHGAKGREWQVVFVPQCNRDVFPDRRSSEGPYLEAERKLFYVSMTRASEHLILSWVATKKSGSREAQEASEFLIEAGIVRPTAPPKAKTPAPARRTAGPDLHPTPATPWVGRAPAATAKKATQAPETSRPVRMVTLLTPRSRVPVDGVDAAKVADVPARIRGERESGLRLDQMTITYRASDADATLPLQLALALEGIPYMIAPEHRIMASPLVEQFRTARASGKRPVDGSLAADVIAALERVLTWLAGGERRRLAALAEGDIGADADGIQFVAG
ncbi:MAG TPA: ATP-dependent helicase [Thermomicrobiales bacterium]|nr:ATP-dependent helicase [Thermomicrobiales bacterium]